jgi:hypothetical protein
MTKQFVWMAASGHPRVCFMRLANDEGWVIQDQGGCQVPESAVKAAPPQSRHSSVLNLQVASFDF